MFSSWFFFRWEQSREHFLVLVTWSNPTDWMSCQFYLQNLRCYYGMLFPVCNTLTCGFAMRTFIYWNPSIVHSNIFLRSRRLRVRVVTVNVSWFALRNFTVQWRYSSSSFFPFLQWLHIRAQNFFMKPTISCWFFFFFFFASDDFFCQLLKIALTGNFQFYWSM